MDNEFRKVTRKKWITRTKVNWKHPRHINHDCSENMTDEDINNFMKKLRDACLQMENDDYFKKSTKTLQEAIHNGSQKDVLGKDTLPIQKIVCFGLGSFTTTFQALHQLSFILNVQKFFRIPEALFYDPIFQESEKLILKHMQCAVMEKDCDAKYYADVKTIFYMPHCSSVLTNNLLWKNWDRDHLGNIILINNSFVGLITNNPERLLKVDTAYIVNIKPFTVERELQDVYRVRNVFNDLSVHTFQIEKLPEKESSFWQRENSPVYIHQEFCVNRLRKLIVNE